MMYYYGRGVKQNGKLAAMLFGKTAKGGQIAGYYWLGYMFFAGNTLKKDKKEGVDLLFRAVRRGYQPARMYAITIAQKLLKKKGHDPGPADGEMGSRTRGVIAAYRRKANLAGKPVVDKPLLHSLNTVTHRAGSFTFANASATQSPNDDREVCGKAISLLGDEKARWENWGEFKKYVAEAKRRGLSLENCAALTEVKSSKPSNLDSSRDTCRGAGPTVEERLARVRALVEKGLITEEEAAAKRAEIMKDI
jgi:hypothetical protein